jgi:hypothetical protein
MSGWKESGGKAFAAGEASFRIVGCQRAATKKQRADGRDAHRGKKSEDGPSSEKPCLQLLE